MSGNFRNVVKMALEGLNIEKAAAHSQIDHHTPGLNYLNLQRSDKFTLKLYLIEGLNNNNGGYLIHPHSHRYEFSTTVLAGQIKNVVLNDADLSGGLRGDKSSRFPMNRFNYSFEGGAGLTPERTWLEVDPELSLIYTAGDSYYLNTKQIHTLETFDVPTLLCLSQFEDKQQTSSIYLPPKTKMPAPTGRRPTLEETEALRLRCLELLQ